MLVGTTRDARSHRSRICRVFEPHVSALCLPRRVDSCLPLGWFLESVAVCDERGSERVWSLAYLWFPGLSVSQAVSVTLVWSLAFSDVYGVLLSFFLLPGFASLPHRLFFFCLSGPRVTYVLFLFVPSPFSPHSTPNFYFLRCPFFVFSPLCSPFFDHSPYGYISYSPSA